ncbi:MAG: DUF3267 domain-containing protein [Anaerolineae bacterium]|nr:DUF3267 domain-containing protein [Anaerolineae bacterium]
MDLSEIPASPPAGYRQPYRFTYPMLGLQIGALAMLLALVPFLGVLTWVLQGQPSLADTTSQLTELLDSLDHLFSNSSAVLTFGCAAALLIASIVVPLTIVVVTIIVHELIHGLAYRALGYRVSYGFYWKLGCYAIAPCQFQQRRHNIVVALAPLVVITLVMAPLLAVQNILVVAIALLVLLLNTSAAAGDLYSTWWLLKTPPHTLLYDVDVNNSFVYAPE